MFNAHHFRGVHIRESFPDKLQQYNKYIASATVHSPIPLILVSNTWSPGSSPGISEPQVSCMARVRTAWKPYEIGLLFIGALAELTREVRREEPSTKRVGKTASSLLYDKKYARIIQSDLEFSISRVPKRHGFWIAGIADGCMFIENLNLFVLADMAKGLGFWEISRHVDGQATWKTISVTHDCLRDLKGLSEYYDQLVEAMKTYAKFPTWQTNILATNRTAATTSINCNYCARLWAKNMEEFSYAVRYERHDEANTKLYSAAVAAEQIGKKIVDYYWAAPLLKRDLLASSGYEKELGLSIHIEKSGELKKHRITGEKLCLITDAISALFAELTHGAVVDYRTPNGRTDMGPILDSLRRLPGCDEDAQLLGDFVRAARSNNLEDLDELLLLLKTMLDLKGDEVNVN